MTMARATLDSASWLALAGRLLIAAVFIPSGVDKALNFTATAAYIGAMGVPAPQLCAIAAIAIEAGLGLLVAIGFKARLAALGLALFVAVITPIFHGFWQLPAPQRLMQEYAFWKNVAIVGGLLVLAGQGAGRWALERGRQHHA
jgi:putative oxidoreductase